MQAHTHHQSLVSDWLYHLERREFCALADHYHQHAVLQVGPKIFQGAGPIVQAIAGHAPQMREIVLAGLRFVHTGPEGVIFETSHQGRFGHIGLRHDVAIHNDRIRHHRVQIQSFAPPNSVAGDDEQ